jgi:hypothetical protein
MKQILNYNDVLSIINSTKSLPDSFDQWGLVDRDDKTVAHIAAKRGHLPADFNQWDLTNNSGKTVAEVAPEAYRKWRIAGEFDTHEASESLESPLI